MVVGVAATLLPPKKEMVPDLPFFHFLPFIHFFIFTMCFFLGTKVISSPEETKESRENAPYRLDMNSPNFGYRRFY